MDVTRAHPSRRSFLRGLVASSAALGIASATGCTISVSSPNPPDGHGVPRASEQPDADADVSLLTDAIADEEALLRFCRALARRHPALTALVDPIRARQTEHVTGLRSALTTSPTAGRSGIRQVPKRRPQAVEALAQLVSAAETDRLADSLAARSGLLARLLASVSASHAVTVQQIGSRP